MDTVLPNELKVLDLLRRNRVAFAALFGSRAKGEQEKESDYDLLIEFEPDASASLFHMAGIQHDLEDLLQKPVDLVTTGGLHPLMKDKVMSSLKVLYDQREG
jgi:predicted nucleotidyltransferase